MSVLCVGQLVADIVVRPVDQLPKLGTTVGVEDLELVAGGCAANTASVLAKLGTETSIAGLVGSDPFGDVVLADISKCGVNIDPVSRDAEVSTSSVVVVVGSNGERSFLYREGGNESLTADMISDEALRKSQYVHVGGAMKLLKFDLTAFLARAKAMGCVVSLDTDWDVSGKWMETIEKAIGHIDYLLTNEEEGRMITGEDIAEDIGQKLLLGGARAVVVKRGHLGSIVVSRSGVGEYPGLKVLAVDTTCAGDSFAAGFIHGLTKGWSLDRCAWFGNAAGALSTTQISHRAITSFANTMGLLESQMNDLQPSGVVSHT